MRCDRCEALELEFINRTEEYIHLVERRMRMLRHGDMRSACELDEAIITAKTAMHDSLAAWHEHRQSHANTAGV